VDREGGEAHKDTSEVASGEPVVGDPMTHSALTSALRALNELTHTLTKPATDALGGVGEIIPAWRRRTAGEPRWAVSGGVAAAIALQVSLPRRFVVPPGWLFPALGAVLVLAMLIANPTHIDRRTPLLRGGSIALIVTMSLANAGSAIRLVLALLNGTSHENATQLLLSGGAIWLANVIVFALWYWELDRGGPADRANAVREYPDLLFPQMASPDFAPPDWEPLFFDYLYLSFTNATAFSPTDVMPLVRWAKMTMMLQSAVSLATVALVIARAVNILGV
jgi:uncharacterized membrane protein